MNVMSSYLVWLPLGNCDVDFYIFRHCFHIMRLKFLKFKRGQNASENFLNFSKECKNSQKLTSLMFTSVKFH